MIELAFELEEKRGTLDLHDTEAQNTLLKWLYNRLGKRNDPKFRYSARFEDQEGDRSPSEHWAFSCWRRCKTDPLATVQF